MHYLSSLFLRSSLVLTFGLVLIFGGFSAGARQENPTPTTPTLVVYTYDSFGGDIMDAMAEVFFQNYGVELDFVQPGDTGEVFTRLYLERTNPQADVFVGLDQTYLHRLLADNLAESYRPSALNPRIPEPIIDTDYRVIPFDFGYITLNYDAQGLGDRTVPTTWQELTGPDFDRSIIMLNPASSSPGRNFLLLTIAKFGEDGYLDFWRALKPSILTVAGGWSEGYGLYGQGEAPLVVSYDTSPAYHRIFEETDQYRSLPLDGEGYLQVEVAGIVRGTKNRDLAEKFIDLLLSPEIQELIPLNQFMYPIQANVALPEGFESANDRILHSVMLDNDLVAANFDRWLIQWEEVMR
ncbi:MAG: thiamine ABC transporter substrate-binding protein [Spirochaetales bacterium]|nr:thiamine ABC transporter substrate-binding protein [Spirochaetales bacterium]